MADDSGIGRVYVIGFPAAGELSFSFADNILLDHDAPEGCDVTALANGSRRVTGVTADPVRMHYRAPTTAGSSGSPVFDFNDYALLGVHRRGLPDMPRLRGRNGIYAANEGVWIESIRAAIAESEATNAAESAPDLPKRWRSIATTAANTVAAPLKSAAIALGGTSSGPSGKSRLITGMPGLGATGMSPVATQILRSGKASAEEVKAVGSESIVGLDDRTRIFDTNMAPWRMICAIRSYWGTRLSVGTGALIGPNILLTAGHVVFPRDKRSAPDEIEIIPALNGGQRPYGTVKATQVWIHPRWQQGFELQSDVAAIELDKAIGHELGWFGLASRTPEELRFEWAHVTGYPGEKQEAPAAPGGRETAPVVAAQLWHHAAPVLNVLTNRIFYAADTTPGQSGAPIYTYDPSQSPVPVIVGVHAYGKASTPVAVGNANSGAWVDPELFDLISAWREEAAADPGSKR
jgi:glutamyl endopeptidase